MIAKTELIINKGDSAILIVGIKNIKDTQLNYFIRFDDTYNWMENLNKIHKLGPKSVDVQSIKINPSAGTPSGQYNTSINIIDKNMDSVYASEKISIIVK